MGIFLGREPPPLRGAVGPGVGGGGSSKGQGQWAQSPLSMF